MVGDYERRFILLFNMNSMTRRDAARLIGGTTASLLLPISASRAQLASKSLTVLTRAIPSSGEKLPVIAEGPDLLGDAAPVGGRVQAAQHGVEAKVYALHDHVGAGHVRVRSEETSRIEES